MLKLNISYFSNYTQHHYPNHLSHST